MSDLTIRELQERAHKTAIEHGWWEGDRNVGELIALMHSELSEALEEWRKGELLNVARELADCVIRIADFCERHGFDLTALLETKMAYNDTREFRHGGKRA